MCHLWSSWRARHFVRPSATLAPGEGPFVHFCWLFSRSSPATGSLANIFLLSDHDKGSVLALSGEAWSGA
jgi:hypothetical protein